MNGIKRNTFLRMNGISKQYPGTLALDDVEFDVFSGEVKRAPEVFIRLNLEWFYRLIKQPSRITRMLRIPVFLVLCISKRIFKRSKGSL